MRVAVLISGQMRAAEVCAPGIVAAFPGAEFFVVTPFGEDAHKAVLFGGARYYVIDSPMSERPEHELQRGLGCASVQGVLRQLRDLRTAWERYAAADHADVVVRCRPDLQFTVPPEPVTVDDALHVPTFANWFGLNDRLAWGSHDVMRRYCTRLDRLDEYIDQGGVFHAESFLAWAMQGVTVKRTRAVFASVRKDGTRDEPVWAPYAGDLI